MSSKASASKLKPRGAAAGQDVAIVGIGCRFPEAEDYSSYWNNMINHVNSVKPISYERWQNGRYGLKNEADLGWDNEQFVKYCASLSGIDKFDNAFFNLSPREVASMDPQQRILLEETWHCLEDSGIPLAELQKERTSVYVGVTGNDYGLIALTGGEQVDHYAGLGNFECIAANRISHYLGLTGESLSLDTACSSSLVAVHKARQNLQAGEAKYAIAAGVCLAYHPWRYVTFSKSNMMSRDGQCKAFDENADGFVQGEGVGVLLLQKLEDAVRDGNHVYGIIRGTAVNHCGASQTIAAPSMKAQRELVEAALRQARVDASTVNYIEAHGTGTALGDPIEVEALTQVFRQYTDQEQFCTIGSVKTNIGHLASASGVAGIIRVLLMMKHKTIPKLLNLTGLNPLLDWEHTPFKVATDNTEWVPVNEQTPLRAGVSGFGFGGVNAHVILEAYEPPKPARAGRNPASGAQLFTLSALNRDSLNGSIAAWKSYMNSPEVTDASIGELCKTLLAGRRHCREFRIGAVVRSKQELAEFLQSAASAVERLEPGRNSWSVHFTNVIYTGYTEIKSVMEEPYIREVLEEVIAETELRGGQAAIRSGISIAKWNKDKLAAYSFLINYTLAKVLINLGVEVASVSGEQQGTLLAMAVSGMITPAKAFDILTGRATLAESVLQRPELTFIDPVHQVKIRPINIGTAYIAELRKVCITGADVAAFRHYVEKARILSRTQFTFKKYLRDWDQVPALQAANLSADSLLHQEKLLVAGEGGPELERQRVLLLLIAYGSLLKLNQKWDLSERITLSDERLNEWVQLVLDDVISKEMAVRLLTSTDEEEAGVLEAVRDLLNERQEQLNLKTPYTCLREANHHMAEIADFASWREQLQEQCAGQSVLQSEVIRLYAGNKETAALSLPNGGIFGFQEVLLKLWQAGADLEWSRLYPGGSFMKRPLPGYAFNRSSHWMAAPQAAPAQSHPMIDLAKSSPERLLFVKTLKVSDFYVGEHIVDERVILPGVAYLEMVRAAGEFAARTQVHSIKDVLWVNRLEVADTRDAYIQLTPESGYLKFQVYTAEKGIQLIHCTGKLYTGVGPQTERRSFNLDDIRARGGARIAKDFCYNEVFAGSIGFQYGPSFQATTEALCGGGESLEQLDLPQDLLPAFSQYVLHPSLVDAALRAVTWIGGAEAYKQLRLHIPFALGEVRIFGSLTPSCYSYAEIVPETAGKAAGMKRFNVYILNEQGEVLVEARDFTIRAIQGKNPVNAAGRIHLYTERWQEAQLPEAGRFAVHSEVKSRAEVKNVLYFARDKGNVHRLAEAFAREHTMLDNIIIVNPGADYSAAAESLEYSIRPAREADYGKLLTELLAKGIKIDAFLYEWDWEQTDILNAFYPVLYLFKAVTQLYSQNQVRFLLGAVRGGSQPEAGMLRGLSKAFQAINHSFIPSVIYCEHADEIPFNAAQELLYHKQASFVEASYAGGARAGRAILPLESLPVAEFSGFRKYGTYLITGGMGKLGLAVAEFALRHYEANVVLTGRSALDEPRSRELERLQSYPGQVIYLPGDIANRQAAGEIVAQAKEAFHSINGVIHCAGVLGEQPLLEASPEQMAEVLLPKVQGAINLDEVTQQDKLDFFVLFSSISAIIGDFARGTYAAGNSFLDRFAVLRTEQVKAGIRSGASLSINWPVWNDGAMQLSGAEAVQYRQQAGMEQLDTQAGLELLEQLVTTGESRIIVACGERQQLNRVLGAVTAAVTEERPQHERVLNSSARSVHERQQGVVPVVQEQQRAAAPGGATAPVKLPVLSVQQQPQSSLVSTVRVEEAVQQYLKGVVSQTTGIPAAQLNISADFSSYGIDSIMIMELNGILGKDFSDLPSTLFFEYSTIAELTAFFMDNHTEFFQKSAGASEHNRVAEQQGAIVEVAAEEVMPVVVSDEEIIVREAAVEEEVEVAPAISRHPAAEAVSGDIAIIGLSGQYPMADTLEEFWEVLSRGQDCVTEIPPERWDYRKDYHPEKGKPGKVYTKWGAFMKDVEKFDAGFFHISPREAELMDPQERLMLQSTYHTLEDAGTAPDTLSGKKVGVFIGVMNSHYQMLGAEQYMNGRLMDVRSSFASIANRISYHFNFKGPSLAIDTMCSSALVAIHMACESIRHGESEMAVAGSVNTIVHPAKYIFLADQRFGSTEGKCRAFGQGGDGYVPGEGVGAVLLKPLEAALRDGDPVYGLIKGTAVNHGGKVSSYTVPNPNAQSELIEEALRRSGVHPEQISYIEAHGTGTALGDPIEVAGLTKAFKKFTAKTQFCAIGSVKSNIGHLESAAGMASLTKVLLQMKHKQLVPSILAEQLNENIDFAKTPFYVQRSLQPWEPLTEETPDGLKVQPLRAGISSFGAGGTNAHIIIEQYEPDVTPAARNEEQLIVLSAKSKDKLQAQARQLAAFIGRHRKQGRVSNTSELMAARLQAVQNRCLSAVAEVLGVNPGQIDSDEDLTELCTDAIHQVRLAAAIKELFPEDAADNTLRANRSLRELMNHLEAAEFSRRNAGAGSDTGTHAENIAADAAGMDAGTDEYTLRLEDVAYTLQVGREAFAERVAIVSRNIGELREVLIRFAAGEPNLPDVYTGSLDPQRDIAAVLFQNESGQQFIGSAVRNRQLPQIAQLWLLKAKIDWKLLHDERSRARVIPLPNYIFDKKRYWIGNSFSEAAAEASRYTPEAEPEWKPEPANDKQNKSIRPQTPQTLNMAEPVESAQAFESTVEQILNRTLEEVIYMESEGINADLPFSELGVNSVLTLELVDKLNDRLGLALHSNDLFNYNTVRLLTAHILETAGTVAASSGNAGLAVDGPIDLNELELLLEGS
ncbi:SDR family NAD(P)-dependent oxidoreductase [Paenibacillus borealis]|uniref:SDR family NAD(P)-dependent oxidoreductase n=1 Tax=Paenibacillus borealis TaxID=160799 RepID=UPI000694706A|nr:SDR family NAD(P)-dependent oxidoreductase [Paenibacillus borealis]